MQHDIHFFLDNLEGVEWDDRSKSGMAYCPAHPDVGTSMKGLSISLSPRGKVLVHCHSCGAKLQDVLNALNELEDVDVEEDVKVNLVSSNGSLKRTLRQGMDWWVEKTGVPESVWEELGCVEEGTGVAFLFDGFNVRKIRTPPKEFKWVGSKTQETPVLWPVPNDDLPEHVWILEGESDTGTAAAAGHYAFALTKGAGRGEKRYLSKEAFIALRQRGVNEVTLCGDADEAGAEMRESLSHMAVDAGMVVNVVKLETILDPFSGINDLNGVWRETSPEQFAELIARATVRVATRYPVLDIAQLEALAEQEIEWLMPHLIAPSDKIILSGPQKSYKTWITLDLVRSLADGKPFLNRKEWTPTRPVKVLFVEEEGSPPLWARRVRRLKLENRGNVLFLHRQGIRFTQQDTIDELIALCREHEIEVLILDPLQRMMAGVDENSSNETGIVWDEVFRLQYANPGMAVMVVHHSNKTERLNWESVRGSSRHAGEVDLGLFVEKHPIEDNVVRVAVDGRDIPQYLGTGENFEARVTISKDGEEPHFRIDAGDMARVKVNQVTGAAQRNKDAVLAAINQGAATAAAITSVAEVSENTCKKYLAILVEEGTVVETDNGAGKAKTYTLGEDVDTDA